MEMATLVEMQQQAAHRHNDSVRCFCGVKEMQICPLKFVP